MIVCLQSRAVTSALSLLAILPSSLVGQNEFERRPVTSDSSFICVLKNTDVDAFHYARDRDPALVQKTQAADIVLTFVSQVQSDPWPEQAKEAVNYAAGIWAGIVSSEVPIRIEAKWTDLGSCDVSQFSLASAGPQFIYRNFRNAPQQNTWYPDALADALNAGDMGAGKADIQAQFNRSCGPSGSARWYLSTDGRPSAGSVDMVTVALHEFAHGLGISGSAEVDDGQSSNGAECNGTEGEGCIGTGSTNNPLAYDRFVDDGNGVPLLALSNPSAALGSALEGDRAGGIFFSGPMLNSFGFSRARLYAPPTFVRGASFSHLDENTFNRTPDALMTPFISRAESIHAPGMVACGILADIGWTLTGDCSETTTATEPLESVGALLTVDGPYPNPVADEAFVSVSVTSDQHVTISVFDPLGRRVLDVYEGLLPSGRTDRFSIPASRLRSGIYLLSISGAFGTTTRSLVVAR